MNATNDEIHYTNTKKLQRLKHCQVRFAFKFDQYNGYIIFNELLKIKLIQLTNLRDAKSS